MRKKLVHFNDCEGSPLAIELLSVSVRLLQKPWVIHKIPITKLP
jgi:hypothetical protein